MTPAGTQQTTPTKDKNEQRPTTDLLPDTGLRARIGERQKKNRDGRVCVAACVRGRVCVAVCVSCIRVCLSVRACVRGRACGMQLCVRRNHREMRRQWGAMGGNGGNESNDSNEGGGGDQASSPSRESMIDDR